MTRALVVLFAVLVAAVLGCPPVPAVPDGGGLGGGSVDGGMPDGCAAPSDDCAAAECTLARLGCTEARTPKGTTFAQACRRAQADGRNWRPDCLAQVQACGEVATAYRTSEGSPCPKH